MTLDGCLTWGCQVETDTRGRRVCVRRSCGIVHAEAPIVWVPMAGCERCGGSGWVTEPAEAAWLETMYGLPRRAEDGASLCPCSRREGTVTP